MVAGVHDEPVGDEQEIELTTLGVSGDLLDDRQVVVAGRRAVVAPPGGVIAGAEHEHAEVHLTPLRRHGIAGLTFSPPTCRGCRAAPVHTRQYRILPQRSGSRRRSATLARVGSGSRCALRRSGTSPARWPPRVPDSPCRTPPG